MTGIVTARGVVIHYDRGENSGDAARVVSTLECRGAFAENGWEGAHRNWCKATRCSRMTRSTVFPVPAGAAPAAATAEPASWRSPAQRVQRGAG
eukprot:1410-Pyramimonas_sp.AAC.1